MINLNKINVLLIFFLMLLIFFILKNNKKEKFQEQIIPKVIYQTIKDKNNISENLLVCIDKLKKMNPDYNHVLLDDKDIDTFIKTNYSKDIYDIYKSINDSYGPAKADLFRYLILYKNGGVYLDIKSGCNKPLNQLIKSDDEFLLYYWDKENTKSRIGNENGEIPQWYIISKPGHAFLKKIIENVCKNILNYDISKHGYGKQMVLKMTGPDIFTLSIEECMKNDDKIKYRFVKIFNYLIYNNIKIPNKKFDIMSHQNEFKNHYSTLKTPLTKYKLKNMKKIKL